MVNPTLTFSIDRTSLSLSPLVLSALPGASALGIVAYRKPALIRRNTYAPDSPYSPGATLLSSVVEQTNHALSVLPQDVATQAEVDDAIAELYAAISQFPYEVTVTENGEATTTVCDPGSMTPDDTTRISLAHLVPVWSVVVPCFPIPV